MKSIILLALTTTILGTNGTPLQEPETEQPHTTVSKVLENDLLDRKNLKDSQIKHARLEQERQAELAIVEQERLEQERQAELARLEQERKAQEIAQAQTQTTNVATTQTANVTTTHTTPVQENTQTQGEVPYYVYQVVEAEAGPGYSDKLNVASVIYNRVQSGRWGGTDPISVVTAPGQFVVHASGAAAAKTPSNSTIQAVNQAFSGQGTQGIESFRASGDGVTNVFF